MRQSLLSEKRILFWLIVGLVCASFCLTHKASAETILLKQDTIFVYIGDQFHLNDYVIEDYQNNFMAVLNENTQSNDCIELSEQQVVTTKQEGTAYLDVSYLSATGTNVETLVIHVVKPQELLLDYGTASQLEAQEMYEEGLLTYSVDQDSVVVSQEGIATVEGFREATIYARRNQYQEFVVAKVTVATPKMAGDAIYLAKGVSKLLEVDHFSVVDAGESVTWSNEENDVVRFEGDTITAIKTGTATAKATLTAKNSDKVTLEITVVVTNPVLSQTSIVLAKGMKKNIILSGVNPNSTIVWSDVATGIARFSSAGQIYALSEGSITLHVLADGKTLNISVRVTNPRFASKTFVMYKGMSKKIKFSGLCDKSVIKCVSSKSSVVKTTASGKLTAKKVGHATIKAMIDGKIVEVWVEVSSKKGYKASKKAISISKTKTVYSQPRRMSKGYYDCSSLVARSYWPYGITFGGRKKWAPVAADIGKWCVKKKKAIAYKGISYKKLLPGDLIFFSSNKNGRYKNITHIEIYTGNGKNVSASSIYGKVVHYDYDKTKKIVLIARPTK